MVVHVAYDKREYRDPDRCLEDIREHVEAGWQVTQLRGPRKGPFLVVFRKEDAPI